MERYQIPNLKHFLKNEYPADKEWLSFFKMWLDARGYYYSSADAGIVDGARDAGFDAIAFAPNELRHLQPIVIQSKYFSGEVPAISLNRFLKTVEIFRNNDVDAFHELVRKSVRENLKDKYQSLWLQRKNIKFVLVTSGRIDKKSHERLRKLKVHLEDKSSIHSLHRDMAEGKTPRPEKMELGFSGKVIPIMKSQEHSLYVISARLSDFAVAYRKHTDSLFAGNVRLSIEGDAIGVKKGVRTTIDEFPHEFAYYHNGITIVCRKIKFSKKIATIFSPSVVNGAQTITYIGRNMQRKVPGSAKVLVKIVEVENNIRFTHFETDIAISSNTQNKVNVSDLVVVNPDLVSLERFFASHGWFLQRKRGKFPPGNQKGKISKDELLQCLAAINPKIGPSAAKDKQKLYKDNSRDIFAKYNVSLEARRNALFVAQLSQLLRRALSSYKSGGGSKKSKKTALAKYPTLMVFCAILQRKKLWKIVRSSLAETGIGKHEDLVLNLEDDLKRVLKGVLAFSRKNADKNDLTTFFKNKDQMTNLERRLVPSLARKFDRWRYT